MKLTYILSVFTLFAFSRAILEDEAAISPALSVEQELALLVTGDVNACSTDGNACSEASQCCSSCCKVGLCVDSGVCDATCIADGSTIRSCAAGTDCCSGCCYNSICQTKDDCSKAIMIVILIWVGGICCSILCCAAVITGIVCLVKKSRNNGNY